MKDFCPETLDDAHRDLQRAMVQWRIRYHALLPQVFLHVSADHPENEILELPSSYKSQDLPRFGLSITALIEHEIRLGHAYDSIDDIRTGIHIYNATTYERWTQMFGQRQGTRASTVLSALKSDIQEYLKRYRSSYTALLALGLPKSSELRPIEDNELRGKDVTAMRKQGDSKRKEPWFRVIGKPRDLSNDDWEMEREYIFTLQATLITHLHL